mmetsp:Transcript_5931/g.14655  ORF Transcript_5931/g.14655 Transcript_5931/m.14655 type:complete len:280 (+) Transcript_5931:1106-1945(+)
MGIRASRDEFRGHHGLHLPRLLDGGHGFLLLHRLPARKACGAVASSDRVALPQDMVSSGHLNRQLGLGLGLGWCLRQQRLGGAAGSLVSDVALREDPPPHPRPEAQAHHPGDPGPHHHRDLLDLLGHRQGRDLPRYFEPPRRLLLVPSRVDHGRQMGQLGRKVHRGRQELDVPLHHFDALEPHAVHPGVDGGVAAEHHREDFRRHYSAFRHGYILLVLEHADDFDESVEEYQWQRVAPVLAATALPSRLAHSQEGLEPHPAVFGVRLPAAEAAPAGEGG